MKRNSIACCVVMALVSAAGISNVSAKEAGKKEETRKQWPEHVEKDLEGWTIHVDKRLLKEEKEVGDVALRILGFKLMEITYRVPEESVEKLRKVPIWLDFDHELNNMQYHPSKGWLINNGHDPRMEQSVHIPRAQSLPRVVRVHKQPWVILHELAHALHDRELGFNDPEIREAYNKAKASGKYEKSLLFTGNTVKHYGLTNEKEYFAESTESFFGVNDFYPFVRAELKEHDPHMHELLKRVWGVK
ncbi:MAG: metallopeptidase [Kiritimatiellia bacterium]|nr:metallopeptidase [Kiritimatiellia bacterium]